MTNHDLCKKLRRLNKLQVKWACQKATVKEVEECRKLERELRKEGNK